MKKYIFFLMATALMSIAYAQQTGKEKQLTAVFSYATFWNDQTGPYIETYLSFDAWNINFIKQGNQYQASIDIILTLSKDDSIEFAKVYELKSPAIANLEDDHFNFLDVQRFAISNGIHQLKISVKDKNSQSSASQINEQIAVIYGGDKPCMSSVQMMSSIKPTSKENILSRGGYDMEPYVNDYLPEQIDKIYYYYEVYNIQNEVQNRPVYTLAYIEEKETGRILEETQTAQRQSVAPVIPVVNMVDISTVPSGNYNLVVDIRNEKNEVLLYQRVPFFRSNPQVKGDDNLHMGDFAFTSLMSDEAQLNDYLSALSPICSEAERAAVQEIVKKDGLKEKQRYMYDFWVKRSPLNPEHEWQQYKKRIDYVNSHYAWLNLKGYQTDRGRVYLQYGPPDHIRDEKNFVSTRNLGSGTYVSREEVAAMGVNDGSIESSASGSHGHVYYLPYQIWRYNQLPSDDHTRCFLFWDEFRSGQYNLLHSNAKGEVSEINWERRLSQQQLPENVEGEVGVQFNRGY